jgi:cobalamin biosynthesis Mg chelatase CobN
LATIHKAKDNSLKLILSDHTLFAEFVRDFIDIDILKGVRQEDIEDVTERFLPLFTDAKDSDTVKRINLKDCPPLFVIAITEHESKVNFRSSFKMLQYYVLVLNDYEKEVSKSDKNIVYSKDFMYPPVLPVVFYDGPDRWTAATDFFHRTQLNGVFAKYIPKFEYELIALDQYSIGDLTGFGDTLSLIMIIDKIKTPDEISLLSKLPPDYIERLALNMPGHMKKLLADVVTVLLEKINAPQEEIEAITDKIEERGVNEMFAIENYDVQEARKAFFSEGKAEGKIESAVSIIRKYKATVADALDTVGLPETERNTVIKELVSAGIPYEG